MRQCCMSPAAKQLLALLLARPADQAYGSKNLFGLLRYRPRHPSAHERRADVPSFASPASRVVGRLARVTRPRSPCPFRSRPRLRPESLGTCGTGFPAPAPRCLPRPWPRYASSRALLNSCSRTTISTPAVCRSLPGAWGEPVVPMRVLGVFWRLRTSLLGFGGAGRRLQRPGCVPGVGGRGRGAGGGGATGLRPRVLCSVLTC